MKNMTIYSLNIREDSTMTIVDYGFNDRSLTIQVTLID